MYKLIVSSSLAILVSTSQVSAQSITIGRTEVLSAGDNGNGNLLLAQQATLTEAANLVSLSFYVVRAVGGLRLGICDSTGPGGGPRNLLAQTAGFTAVKGWNTQVPSSLPTLQAGSY